ncbi:hypothetical protein SAMN05421678_12733 [Actinopolymorpha cephalotaxi]|uniref:Uncharacterized protein n=1 Tax=Actinopolymorpha cephalotaxi TaxID=504797 RepID=A0A1I3BW33_9ACTN|nr:hypothetical protein [Actinopolymorpha cephalotaxi]NYH86321.1 hypothetical protein [Actinopolymorpha cephalotaxi]SFH66544.1 hypothetical protein SAMN05421678_12733 [Actinopolymorpha cephalotaxi]
MTSEAWWTTQKAQASIQAIGDAVAQEFGESSKEDEAGPLSRGYVGTSLDHATQTVVVVVDPELVDMERLTERMSAAPGVSGIPLRVEPSAYTSAELLEAGAVVRNRAWHPRAAQVPFTSWLAADSRFVVTLRQEDEDVARALTDRLGDRVRIERGSPRRMPRRAPG